MLNKQRGIMVAGTIKVGNKGVKPGDMPQKSKKVLKREVSET